ncbi:MAG TPA: P1 family peptidase [Gemmatimonadales bacterium]|nr:P1 family peptidase [Gemmatimonadales bacterium]
MNAPAPSFTDIGVTVGHVTHAEAGTGCTVVLAADGGMRAAAYIRGRATGTREFDALSPRHLVPHVDAILLTGGSAFGLGAADGAMRWLAERGRGFPVGIGVVPIVPAAVVFDLGPIGHADRWPGPDDGYAACAAAAPGVTEGSVGAGTGATVGKALGIERAMKGGVGSWAVRHGNVVIGALAVVNAYGDVRDATGNILAGARDGYGGFSDARAQLAAGNGPTTRFGTNTTLVVVGTNAQLDRHELAELARSASDALARRITPVGTAVDGDVIFAISAGDVAPPPPLSVELIAQDVTAMAIERAVRLARGTTEVPGLAG